MIGLKRLQITLRYSLYCLIRQTLKVNITIRLHTSIITKVGTIIVYRESLYV